MAAEQVRYTAVNNFQKISSLFFYFFLPLTKVSPLSLNPYKVEFLSDIRNFPD